MRCMLPPYSKPYLSYADQVSLLRSRGLVITQPRHAEDHLARIGYYRLKDYLHPLRQSQQVVLADGTRETVILEDFRTGSTFEQAVNLYIFDKKLKMLLSDAIERIEVALRVDVAHTLGRRDAFAHRQTMYLDPKRSIAIQGGGATKHGVWLSRADEAENRCRADWYNSYKRQYTPPLPIWMAVETWDFGTLSYLLDIAHPVDRKSIAARYKLNDPELLSSWIRTLSYVRNMCAHHSRMWNHPLVNSPKLPKGNDAIAVAHIGKYTNTKFRIYAACAVTQYFLNQICPNSGWKDRLKLHWNTFPAASGISPVDAGFMPTWRNLGLWN